MRSSAPASSAMTPTASCFIIPRSCSTPGGTISMADGPSASPAHQVAHQAGEPEVVGQGAEGVGGEQQDAEQKERAGRDHPLGRNPKRLEQHRAPDQKRQDDEPADHPLRAAAEAGVTDP